MHGAIGVQWVMVSVEVLYELAIFVHGEIVAVYYVEHMVK